MESDYNVKKAREMESQDMKEKEGFGSADAQEKSAGERMVEEALRTPALPPGTVLLDISVESL